MIRVDRETIMGVLYSLGITLVTLCGAGAYCIFPFVVLNPLITVPGMQIMLDLLWFAVAPIVLIVVTMGRGERFPTREQLREG
jgi:hypothetical protein